jgi:hypothetical protein
MVLDVEVWLLAGHRRVANLEAVADIEGGIALFAGVDLKDFAVVWTVQDFNRGDHAGRDHGDEAVLRARDKLGSADHGVCERRGRHSTRCRLGVRPEQHETSGRRHGETHDHQ